MLGLVSRDPVIAGCVVYAPWVTLQFSCVVVPSTARSDSQWARCEAGEGCPPKAEAAQNWTVGPESGNAVANVEMHVSRQDAAVVLWRRRRRESMDAGSTAHRPHQENQPCTRSSRPRDTRLSRPSCVPRRADDVDAIIHSCALSSCAHNREPINSVLVASLSPAGLG